MSTPRETSRVVTLPTSPARRLFFLRIAPLILAGVAVGSALGAQNGEEWDPRYDLFALTTGAALVFSALFPRVAGLRVLAGSAAVATWLFRWLVFIFDSPPLSNSWARLYVVFLLLWMIASTISWTFAAELSLASSAAQEEVPDHERRD